MKNGIALILTLFIYTTILANNIDSAAYAYSNKAESFYYAGKMDSAINIWKDIVSKKEKYPVDIYGTSFYNIAIAYWDTDLEESKKWFIKITESDLKDNDETGSLMEPHTNYKHKSARWLAEIAFKKKSYEESLDWLYKSDTLYPYWGFEGSSTSISKVANNSLALKVELYNLMNMQDELANLIIRELIYSGRMGMFMNQAKDTLDAFITEDKNFINDFNEALDKIEVQNVDSTKVVASYTFKGVKNNLIFTSYYDDYPIHRYWVYVQSALLVNKDYVVKYIKDRGFYKQLFLKTDDYKKFKLADEFKE